MRRSERIGSLFSGIGGLDRGLEWAGLGHTVWQVEKDEWCRNVLQKHWPTATRYDDVRAVGKHCLEPVDVICGGFPCTDISLAGRGAGLEGAHSGLWFEYLRVVRELRPKLVVIENVAALRTRGLDRVLSGLAESGYDALWFPLRASDVGAPHKRERLFVVAYTHEPGLEGRRLSECGRGTERAAWQGSADRSAEGSAQSSVGGSAPRIPAGLDGSWPAGRGQAQHEWEPPRVASNVPQRRQRLQALGNAVVPQVAYAVGLVAKGVLERISR